LLASQDCISDLRNLLYECAFILLYFFTSVIKHVIKHSTVVAFKRLGVNVIKHSTNLAFTKLGVNVIKHSTNLAFTRLGVNVKQHSTIVAFMIAG
jgi:hypothetical protein